MPYDSHFLQCWRSSFGRFGKFYDMSQPKRLTWQETEALINKSLKEGWHTRRDPKDHELVEGLALD